MVDDVNTARFRRTAGESLACPGVVLDRTLVLNGSPASSYGLRRDRLRSLPGVENEAWRAGEDSNLQHSDPKSLSDPTVAVLFRTPLAPILARRQETRNA